MTTSPTTVELERRGPPGLGALRERATALSEARWAPYLGLATVVGFAFVLYAWGVSTTGYGNTYYAAAVRSMSLSWHNFFFASFDPGGFITVDKPPVFLWFGALSARIFGYSSWSILLPSAIAGAASVALLWLSVRRYFGTLAGTIAAAVLAVTPVSVAVDRLNLPEPFMILALVGAAYCTIRSLDDGRRWWAWAAAAGLLVGVAFNTKMLAAWIPGPAFALAMVVGWSGHWRTEWRATWRRNLGRLAILGVVTLLASASWMVVLDQWPASSRPYIGGSTDNTVQDLVLGYNGFGRVDGESQGAGGGGPGGGQRNFTPPAGTDGGQGTQQRDGNFTGQNQQPGGAATGNGGTAGGPGGAGGAGNTGAGGIIAGTPGWTRMFDSANGGQIAWLLPFALLGIVASLWMYRRQRVQRSAIVLWGGWLLLYGGIFSFAEGIYHSYYTSALAPGAAALVGITVAGLVTQIGKDRRWLFVAMGIAAVTAALQLHIAGRTPDFFGAYRYIAIALLAAALLALALVRSPRLVGLALAGVVGALLVIPTTWSVSEAFNAPLNTTLPQAGARSGTSARSFGSEAFDGGTDPLAAWLQANADPDARWQLVVSSAMNASTLVAEYSLSVMPIGGFSGRDAAITVDQFADLVANGDVRYVLASQGGGFAGAGGLDGLGSFGNIPGLDGTRRGTDGQGAAGQGATGLGATGQGVGGQDATGQGVGGQDATGQGFTRDGGLGTGAGATAQGTGTGAGAAAGGGANQFAGGGPGGGATSSVLTTVRSVCTLVTDPTLPAANQGSMYDCAGKAEALRAAG